METNFGCSPATSRMLRKPCAVSARASRSTSSTRQRHAQDRVVAREAAVFAVVDALVGKVERREQADDLAEALLGQRLRAPAHRLQQFAGGGRNQGGKIAQGKMGLSQDFACHVGRGGQAALEQAVQRQGIELSDKAPHSSSDATHGPLRLDKVVVKTPRLLSSLRIPSSITVPPGGGLPSFVGCSRRVHLSKNF